MAEPAVPNDIPKDLPRAGEGKPTSEKPSLEAKPENSLVSDLRSIRTQAHDKQQKVKAFVDLVYPEEQVEVPEIPSLSDLQQQLQSVADLDKSSPTDYLSQASQIVQGYDHFKARFSPEAYRERPDIVALNESIGQLQQLAHDLEHQGGLRAKLLTPLTRRRLKEISDEIARLKLSQDQIYASGQEEEQAYERLKNQRNGIEAEEKQELIHIAGSEIQSLSSDYERFYDQLKGEGALREEIFDLFLQTSITPLLDTSIERGRIDQNKKAEIIAAIRKYSTAGTNSNDNRIEFGEFLENLEKSDSSLKWDINKRTHAIAEGGADESRRFRSQGRQGLVSEFRPVCETACRLGCYLGQDLRLSAVSVASMRSVKS